MRIERDWQPGDTVESLPMAVTRADLGEEQELRVGRLRAADVLAEDRREVVAIGHRPDKWPELSVSHDAVELRPGAGRKNPAGSFELVRSAEPLAAQPFTPETAPLAIKAKARRIPDWTMDKQRADERLAAEPGEVGEPVETVTLIPMGAARLRITSFPTIGDGPDAHDWQPPK